MDGEERALTARGVVKLAASRTKCAREWLTRDELGSWERAAQDMIDRSVLRRAELGISDSAAASEMADRLLFLALAAMLEDAKKQKRRKR